MSAVERVWYIDRFEDGVAVLLHESGVSYEIARALLPSDAREGSHVRIVVSVVSRPARSVRDLVQDDDGGDIEL